jgi:hypothetical protein
MYTKVCRVPCHVLCWDVNVCITCLGASFVQALQIYTASLDGTIRLWQYETGQVDHTWNVDLPIESMVLPTRNKAALSIHWLPRGTGRLILFDMAEKQHTVTAEADVSAKNPSHEAQMRRTVMYKLDKPAQLEMSPDRNFVATVDGRRVIVACLKYGKYKLLTMLHTRALTVRFFLCGVSVHKYHLYAVKLHDGA